MDGLEGGCRCGAVRYTLALERLPRSYACHCHQCQRWSGSAFSQQVIVPEPALSVRGNLTVFELTTAERTSIQRYCAACHGRIYNTNTRRPGMAVVRAGTLDRSEELECVLHIFVAYKQRWLTLPEGVPAYPEMAPPEAMMAALRG
ncbi:GFA family protein [Solimonas sp. C16B3]|uniref:GFA family protein n=1 Tax=Solimonas marina TaxID=2714601 RepID=A0A969W6N5_9GAMM|nr:GFA family protein [Solimonas marina]